MSALTDAQARLEDARVFREAAETIGTLNAVKTLKEAGGENAALARLLGEKTKAGYNVSSLTRSKSTKCVEWAHKLLVSAELKFAGS